MSSLIKRASDAVVETDLKISIPLGANTPCRPAEGLTLADVKALDRVYPGIVADDTALYRCRTMYEQLVALQRIGTHSIYAGEVRIELTADNLRDMASAVDAYGIVFNAAAGRCKKGGNTV